MPVALLYYYYVRREQCDDAIQMIPLLQFNQVMVIGVPNDTRGIPKILQHISQIYLQMNAIYILTKLFIQF